MNKERFPEISEPVWNQIRSRLRQAVPRVVDESYIRTITGRAESYALNVVQNLRAIGLINDEGKPTDLAAKLRNDNRYSEACKEIIQSVYPPELTQHGYTSSQRREIHEWFLVSAGLSESTARKKAAFYRILVSEIDPNELLGSYEDDLEEKLQDEAESKKVVKPKKVALDPNQKHITLTVRMEINLPSGADAETYDNIFKSIKENLLND